MPWWGWGLAFIGYTAFMAVFIPLWARFCKHFMERDHED